jgi:hypothetical protein
MVTLANNLVSESSGFLPVREYENDQELKRTLESIIILGNYSAPELIPYSVIKIYAGVKWIGSVYQIHTKIQGVGMYRGVFRLWYMILRADRSDQNTDNRIRGRQVVKILRCNLSRGFSSFDTQDQPSIVPDVVPTTGSGDRSLEYFRHFIGETPISGIFLRQIKVFLPWTI